MLSRCFLDFSVGVRASVIGLSQISSFSLHHIRTRLYSLPLKTLHVLYESTLTLHFTNVGSPEHRLQGIILDISQTGYSKLLGFVILLKQRIGHF